MEALKEVLPKDIYSSLENSGIDSLKMLMLNSSQDVSNLTGIRLLDVEKIKFKAANILLSQKFIPASDLPDWDYIKTGCPSIDILMRGGLPVNGINELVGESGVGKTQFCLQLALMVQMPKYLGGLDKNVLYICTEDIFPLKRLKQLAQFFPLRFPQLTKNISFESNVFVEHVADYDQLRNLLYVKLNTLLSTGNIGLIIIDSIAAVFRSENEGVDYTTRGQDFLTIAKKLQEICDQYKIANLCVNQVTANITTNQTEPCLGRSWSNLVTSRFQLSRFSMGKVRKFEVTFAPHIPNNYCQFIINSNGICGIT